MSRKISPEFREEIRQLNEEGRRARAYMQEVIDRIEARKHADRERAARRRRLLRRFLPFGRPSGA